MIEKCLFFILMARYCHGVWVPVTGDVTVTTNLGPVKGDVFKLPDESMGARFLGIPYAKPPIGQLRFKKPESPAPWSKALNATQYGKSCLTNFFYGDMTMSYESKGYYMTKKKMEVDEDCLTLNIFTPLKAQNELNSIIKKIPVMVFIHGGSFLTGGSSLYPAEKLASTGLVVVTLNYRLGILGFLSTGDEHARGNWGMLDQVKALEFVKYNIAAFGGDADKVTIAGTSAGGESVNLHYYSPLSQGLFNRVAAMSGTTNPGLIQKDALKNARVIANFLNCTHDTDKAVADTHKAMVGCLRNKEFSSYPTDIKFMIRPDFGLKFVPVVEGAHADAFLPRDPFQDMTRNPHASVLVTVAQHELPQRMPNPNATTPTVEGLEKKIANIVGKVFKSSISPCWKKVVSGKFIQEYLYNEGKQYSKENPKTEVPKSKLVIDKLLSDLIFKFPALTEANKLSNLSTVYVGEYDYKSNSDAFMTLNYTGAYHGIELQYLFGYPFYNLTNALKEDVDKKFSTQIMQMFRKFAETGVPSFGSDKTWRQYNSASDTILRLAPASAKGVALTTTKQFQSGLKLRAEIKSGKYKDNKNCK